MLSLLLALSVTENAHEYTGALIDERGVCQDPDPYLAEVLRRLAFEDARSLKELEVARPSLPHVPMTVDVQRADVQQLFRLLATTGDINIILHDDVQGEVSLSLVGVPWDQVLDVILLSAGLDAVAGDNLIVVYPKSP